MKKFYDFLKQVFLGETGGLGSKTANMTVKQLVKVGTDMNVSIADAEKMINGFLTKSEDKVLADITSSLADTKKLMSSDDMIEQELRIEYIDGKGADTMSFDEFKLSKKQSQEDLIGPEGFPPAVTSDKRPVFESLKVPSREQQMAIDVQADIDKVSKATGLSPEEARAAILEKMNEGYEIGDPKRRGPKDLANLQAYLQTNLNYSPTDAAMFMEDIEEIAFSGAIDLASDTAKNVSKQEAKQIINSSNTGGETLIDLGEPGGFTQMQKDNKLGQFATDSTNVSNYDELVKQGFYVEGTMKPGPSHPFNNPQKISEVTMANDGGPMTSKVVSNIASWKQDLIRNLDEGIITRSEYDQYYRNAQPIFDDEYAKVKQLDMQNGFVENTYDNRNADKLMMDYYPGENYAAKYTSEADIAATGYVPSDSSLARNKESSDFIKKMIEEPIITEGKILTSQTNELNGYTAALEDAIYSGDMVEAERIKDLLEDAKNQQDAGTPVTDIIFNDSKRSLNAMGGIIQGVRNRGK